MREKTNIVDIFISK